MYRIADINLDIKCNYSYFEKHSEDYYIEDNSPDITFGCTKEEIDLENDKSEIQYSQNYLEFIAISRKIAEFLSQYDGFVFHSACFDVDGVGVAFAAHSGTGKSTHMMLWQKYLGDKMTVVNGDKPIVRFFEDEPNTPYAYGTPWNGKEKLGCNMRTPLKHICFIERSETNYVEKIESKDAIDRIFNQVYMPKDPIAVMNTMSLINRLIDCCDLWVIHCNMDISAAETAYKKIFNKF